ncbi:MAG: uncharacterized protein JWM72_4725 [Actinomycetia bacterium]|nr:uncharacterized protein [Actinomycetes bacterium]
MAGIGQSLRMDLTLSVSEDRFTEALESWAWIGLDDKRPVLSSLFGDMFFESEGGCWYLDLVAGTIDLLWPERGSMDSVLATADGHLRYLRSALAASAESHGIVPEAGRIYDFTKPPVLGGLIDPANLTTIDFVVGVNIAGQIHDQLRGRAGGTSVTRVMISTEREPPRRGFWRRGRG